MQDFLQMTRSAGRLVGGVITAHAGPNGTVDISDLEGMVFTTNALGGSYIYFKIAGTTITPADGAVSWIYFDYNGGNPQFASTVDRSTIHEYDQFSIGRVWRSGNSIEVQQTGHSLYNKDRRIHNRVILKYGNMDHVSGGVISKHATALRLQSNAGSWYAANTPFSTVAKDTFQVWYKSGSATWVESTAMTLFSDIFNGAAAKTYEVYQNGNSLANLTNYGVYWIFMCPEGDLYVVLGTANYSNVGNAQAASIPSDLPPYLVNFGRFVGRVICQKSGAALYSVETVFGYTFTQSAATDYNSLANLPDLSIYHTNAAFQQFTGGEYARLTGQYLATSGYLDTFSPSAGGEPLFQAFTGNEFAQLTGAYLATSGAVNLKAPIDSPAFTGYPTTTTLVIDNNSGLYWKNAANDSYIEALRLDGTDALIIGNGSQNIKVPHGFTIEDHAYIKGDAFVDNAKNINWRNAANDAWLDIIEVDGSNILQLGKDAASIGMNSKVVGSVANGVAASDAVNKSQLDAKTDLSSFQGFTGNVVSTYAPLASPNFTGNPTLPNDAYLVGKTTTVGTIALIKASSDNRVFVGDGNQQIVIMGSATYPVNLNSAKITSLADGTISTDAVNKLQLDTKTDLSSHQTLTGLYLGTSGYVDGLSSVYLGLTAKAADSDKLDGNDSTYFAVKSDFDGHTGLTATAHGGIVSSSTFQTFTGSVASTYQTLANLETSTIDTSTTKYPNSAIVKSAIDGKLSTTAKITTANVESAVDLKHGVNDANTSSIPASYLETTLTNSATKVPASSVINTVLLTSGTSFPATPYTGTLFYRTDLEGLFRYNGTAWIQISGGALGAEVETAAITDNSNTKVPCSNLVYDGLAAKVATTGDETIAGIKTFSSFPITPNSAPTTDYQVANKKYADDNFLKNRAICYLLKRKNQTLSHNTVTAVTFNGTANADYEVSDLLGWHDQTTNPTRITPTIAGWYRATAKACFASNSTGYRVIWFDGSIPNQPSPTLQSYLGMIYMPATNGDISYVSAISPLMYFNGAGDYLIMKVVQTSGGDLALNGLDTNAAQITEFVLELITPALRSS